MDFFISLRNSISQYILDHPTLMYLWWISILIVFGMLLGRFVKKVQKTIIKVRYTQNKDESGRAVTLTQAMTWTVEVVIWIIIFIIIAANIGIPNQTITIFTTVFGAGLGFGMQSLFKDVISSVVRLSSQTFNVGDFITVETSSGSHTGTVENFNLQSVTLSSDTEGKIIVPQGDISVIKNFNYGMGRFVVTLVFEPTVDLINLLTYLQQLVDSVNAREDISAWTKTVDGEEDIAHDDVFTLKLRGVSDVSDGSIKIQVEGLTSNGNQFAMKRSTLKIITNMLYEKGITYQGRMVIKEGGRNE